MSCAGALTTLVVRTGRDWKLSGITCTAAGYLLVSSYLPDGLYAIRIASGEVEEIRTESTDTGPGKTGSGGGGGGGDRIKLSWPVGQALDETDHLLFVANRSSNQIVALPLSDRYFRSTQ